MAYIVVTRASDPRYIDTDRRHGSLLLAEAEETAMLAPMDLRTLTTWCRQRGMCWTALRVDADATVLVLEPLHAARPWQRMRLIAAEHGFLLEDEAGQALASASDLPALLDALDGGVADAPALVLLYPKPRAGVHEHALA